MALCRVAWLNQYDPFSPLAGGVEREIREIGKRLAAMGHSLTVITERNPGVPRSGRMDGYDLLRPSGRVGVHFWAMNRLRRFNGDTDFDVSIQDLAKIVPWTLPGTKQRVPSVMFLHHLFGRHILDEVSPLEGTVLIALERVIPWLERGCFWITETRFHEALLLRNGVPKDHIRVIRPGVNHDFFSTRPAIRSVTPVICYTGRLKKYKRVHLAIEAAGILRRIYPEIQLWIVGSGTDWPRLTRLVKAMGLDSAVRFLGQVDEAGLRDIYQRSWVHVQPSSVEGWGLTILEAAACGTPTVAFRNSVFPETVGPHCETYLAEDGAASSLAEGLAQCIDDLSLSPSEVTSKCAEYARQFNWDQTAAEYSRFLEAVACRRVPGGRPLAALDSRVGATASGPRPDGLTAPKATSTVSDSVP